MSIAAVIHQAIQTSEPAINAGRHKMSVSLEHQPLTVDGDAVRLTQVFANLLNNSAKYTLPEGHIAISTKRDGDEAVVSVRDNGIGITAEMLPRVFDLFNQSSRDQSPCAGRDGRWTSTRTQPCRNARWPSRGSQRRYGQGSEFVVRLPLTIAPSQDEKIGERGDRLLNPGFT